MITNEADKVKEEINKDNIRTISDRNLNDIYNELQQLGEYCKYAQNGCSSLMDYITNPIINIDDVKYQNYKWFFIDAELLRDKVKKIISNEDFKLINKILIKIKIKEIGQGGFLLNKGDMRDNSSWNELQKSFVSIVPLMLKIRAVFVSALNPHLNPSGIKSKNKNN